MASNQKLFPTMWLTTSRTCHDVHGLASPSWSCVTFARIFSVLAFARSSISTSTVHPLGSRLIRREEDTWITIGGARSQDCVDGLDERGRAVLRGELGAQCARSFGVARVVENARNSFRNAIRPGDHDPDPQLLDAATVPELVEQLRKHDHGHSRGQ